ncbi:putative ribonuclease H-like domain-containing protein [Tanacetum coccineum]
MEKVVDLRPVALRRKMKYALMACNSCRIRNIAGGMHVVPPPMTGNYMPSGPDIEVDYSQFTYGPKQTQPSESESQSSEFDTCESNISTEPSELVSEPVVNESNVECQPKVWSDAPIIEEYESDSEDEYVSIPTKQQETPSFANQQVKTPRETVKNQFTHSQKPKVDKKELGYGFTARACFVCGSFSHLIRDCDYHEKRMAKQVELNKQKMAKGNGSGESKPKWNNVQRVNKQNQFVPTAVLTRTGKIPVSTARASSTKIFSTARQSFNRQTVLTSTAMKVNTFKPNVNRVRPANVFHKTHSSSSRPFKKTIVLRTDFSKQKVNTAKDYSHRALKNKGIIDSRCSRHMTGNKTYLAEFQDFNGGCSSLIEFRESLRRVTDGTEALLIPTLFILWLDKVSTDSVKLVPLGKDSTAIDTLKKNTAKALISLLTTITLSTTMAVLDACPKHNIVAYLEKSEGNAEFHEIIDFLKRGSIHHALTKDYLLNYSHPPCSPLVKSNESLPDIYFSQPNCDTFRAPYPDPSPSPSPRPSPQPSPSPTRDHSSNDISLSGNEDEMTLPNVYDFVSLYKSSSKKQRMHKKNVSKQGRKIAKGESSVQRNPLFDVMPEDNIDHMETDHPESEGRTKEMVDEDKEIDEDRVSTEDGVSTAKDGVSVMDDQVGSTEENNGEMKESLESTEQQNRRTEEKAKSTTEQIKIDPKEQGKKKIEEVDESESEDDDIPQAVKKFKQLESDEELARKKSKKLRQTEYLAAKQGKFLAQQDQSNQKPAPPTTKNQLRNQMMTYLKHVVNFKHLNESLIEMKKKDSSKEEEIKQESKEEVKQEDKEKRVQEREAGYVQSRRTKMILELYSMKEYNQLEAAHSSGIHIPDKVYKVEKALYGLHQAPRAWYETLSTYLIENRFRRGTIDKTLFIKKDKGDILLVQIYVDDIIFGSTKKSLGDKFECLMHKRFQMSSTGELTFFLGLQVQQKKDGIFISQDKYVVEILKKFHFATVKAASTPMEPNKALIKDEEADSVDVHLYRSMIGSLMYITTSRPDIMFAVCVCARFQVTPKMSHLHVVKRIFRYLKPDKEFITVKVFNFGEEVDFNGKCKKQTISLHNSTTKSDLVDLLNLVAYETVYKEWEDRMERAVTTASSLDAEQDSGSGPRCQDTILGGVDAQTRFETTSKQSNDPPLLRGYTLGSGEDSMKLLELMELCTKLSDLVRKKKTEMLRKQKKTNTVPHPSNSTPDVPNEETVPTHSNDPLLSGEDRLKLTDLMDICTKLSEIVLDLEHTKTTKAQEITNLKLRVKKLEKKVGLRTHKFKRLYKGKSIEDIDKDVEVSLVNETQRRSDDAQMFDMDALIAALSTTDVLEEQEKEVAEKEVSTADPVTTAGEVVTTANVEATTANAPTTTIDELTLAQTLIEIKAAKPKAVTSAATTTTTTRPKARGVVVQEPSEFKTTSSPLQASQLPQAKDKGKAIMVEPERPLKKKDQVALDEEMARNLEAQMQAELIEEERLARQKEEEANIALIESWDNTQAMMEADFKLA